MSQRVWGLALVGFTGYACSFVLASAALLLCAFAAGGKRPAFGPAAFVLGAAVLFRVVGPAVLAIGTGEPYGPTHNEPISDEALFTTYAEEYARDAQRWYDELLLRRSTRFGAVLYIITLIAYDAGPPGLRLLSLIAAASGILAVWAVARRRLGAEATLIPTLLGIVWPFAASHDASFFREPWLTFAVAWSIFWLVILSERPVARLSVAAVSSYFAYLIQPLAGVSMLLGYGVAEIARWLRAWPGWLRRPAWLAICGAGVVVAALVTMKSFFGEFELMEELETQTRFRAGGAGYALGAEQVGSVIPLNILQYLIGIVFIGVSGAKRLLSVVDYLFWLPICGFIAYRLWQGRWPQFGRPERYCLGLFGFYNAVSAVYVTNVAWAIRKRNSAGVCLFYLLAAALSKRTPAAGTGCASPRFGGISEVQPVQMTADAFAVRRPDNLVGHK